MGVRERGRRRGMRRGRKKRTKVGVQVVVWTMGRKIERGGEGEQGPRG